MHVLRTVVPDALLLDPSRRGAGESRKAVRHPDPAAFPVRRRRRIAHGAVYGLHGHGTGAVLLGVPSGTGYAVVIDTRPRAETFGRVAVASLDGPRALLVPAGCLYGVQALTDRAAVEVRSATREPRAQRLSADPDDPDLQLRWLVPRLLRTPREDRSWAGLCTRLGAPPGPRRDRVSLW
ncbi:dTDP-4-dehydrorhamnose 3,5-epimerase family protein [Pseudonocardia nematodicida]|uniref:dTDP-4-dehydrorhamnose 3,5-epimerase family protein n=1 Tax=Pseudonocardia nematodicida TaxID=1206997 RepID=A0ABV1KKH8_9PSEU